MAYIDMTLPEFLQTFGSEDACLQAVFEARWPRGFVCPYCGHNDGYRLSTRPRNIECCSCRRQTSITSGTLFHRSHLPLTTWFLAIYLMAQDKGGVSASRLENQLGISYPTAWFLIQRLHHAMSKRDENLTLAGYIELDEAFFGGKHRKGGRHGKPPKHGKTQVLVMVESEGICAGNVVMRVINDDQMEDLKPHIAEKVESEPPGQWFISDAWGSHHVVMQFGHRVTMHHIPKEDQDKLLRCVSLAISNAKSFFKGTYHNFCQRHIQRYLDAFAYRWNRRHLVSQLASHLVAACSLCAHAQYKSLIALKQPASA